MRKANPTAVKTRFVGAVAQLEHLLDDAFAKKLDAAARAQIVEAVALTSATLWESFVNDLLVVYINNDSSAFRADIDKRVKASVKDKFGAGVEQRIKLPLHRHLKVEEVQSLLDPKGMNVTFTTCEEMVAKAKQYLNASKAAHFSALPSADRATIDALKAIRNYLAHRSRMSRVTLDNALAVTALPTALKRTGHKVRSLHSYLKAIAPPVGTARIRQYLDVIKKAASTL